VMAAGPSVSLQIKSPSKMVVDAAMARITKKQQQAPSPDETKIKKRRLFDDDDSEDDTTDVIKPTPRSPKKIKQDKEPKETTAKWNTPDTLCATCKVAFASDTEGELDGHPCSNTACAHKVHLACLCKTMEQVCSDCTTIGAKHRDWTPLPPHAERKILKA